MRCWPRASRVMQPAIKSSANRLNRTPRRRTPLSRSTSHDCTNNDAEIADGAAQEREADRHAAGFLELSGPDGRVDRDDRAVLRAELALPQLRHLQHHR